MSLESKKINMVKLAAYYEKTLSPEQIKIYAEQLEGYLTDEECSDACKRYIDDPKNEFFPRPVSKLIGIIRNPVDSESIAVDTASKVIEAVSRYGWNNFSEAMAFIGPLGEKAVKRFGSWSFVCQNLGSEIPLGTFQAQIREILKASQKMSEAGLDNVAKIDFKNKSLIDFKIKEIPKG